MKHFKYEDGTFHCLHDDGNDYHGVKVIICGDMMITAETEYNRLCRIEMGHIEPKTILLTCTHCGVTENVTNLVTIKYDYECEEWLRIEVKDFE